MGPNNATGSKSNGPLDKIICKAADKQSEDRRNMHS